MTNEEVIIKRKQMLRDGYCVIEKIIPEEFLDVLIKETETLIAKNNEQSDFVYQGQHIGVNQEENIVIRKLLSWKPSYDAMKDLGFGDFKHGGSVIILTKEPNGPPLYWHQDWMQWDDPISTSPWPQMIFLNYYLQDTSIENGCLKIIPGSHLKRIDLHDKLIPAHEEGARFIKQDDPIMFSDHPDQICLSVRAGSLVLGDGRVLHSAGKNYTTQRRTLILGWHSRSNDTIPEYWKGNIPYSIIKRDPYKKYEMQRIPGKYLKP